MIKDVMKLVRLGALVFVLLPIIKPDLASAYEVEAGNEEDRLILSKDLIQPKDWKKGEIERLLKSIKEPNEAKINAVSVTEILSLRVQTFKCEMKELLNRRRIAFALINQDDLKAMHKFAQYLFASYVNSCFDNAEKIAKLFADEMIRIKSSRDTVESFLRKVFLQDKTLGAQLSEATYIDDDLFFDPISKYLEEGSDPENLESVKASCKEVLTRDAILSTLATCLKPGPVQDAANKLIVYSYIQPTCSALDKKLGAGLAPQDCRCGLV